MGAFYDAWSEASCTREERCASVHGREFSNAAACAAFMRDWAWLYRNVLGIDLYAWLESTHLLGPASAQAACIDALATLACDAAVPGSCAEAMPLKDPVGIGGDCTIDVAAEAKLCDVGLACVVDDAAPGCSHCRALQADGQPCGASSECVSDFCNETCSTAVTRARGESCSYGASDVCAGNLSCEGPLDGATCRDQVGLGADCGSATCFSDLYCDDSPAGGTTCQAYGDDGDPCDRGVTTRCKNGCVFANPGAAHGVCRSPPELPGAGEACVLVTYWGSPYPLCATGTFPEETVDGAGNASGCTCVAKRAVGADCSFSAECVTDVCAEEDLRCAAKLPDGDTCYDDDECLSGHCAPSTWECAAPPVCP